MKILDFGLAKALEEAPAASGSMTNSPTISAAASRDGMILGTAAYMSPEQARGKVVDRRCDIWSFGAVLFEMLSGKQAFPGEDVSHTLAGVIMKEPDWNVLPDELPAPVGRLLRRCLTKDPKQRLQAIGEARIAIEEAVSGAAGVVAGLPGQEGSGGVKLRLPTWHPALPWVLAGLLAIAVSALSIGFFDRAPQPSVMHFRTVTNFAGVQAQPSLSPDGRSVAFVSNRDGHYNIYVGLISGGSLVQITKRPESKISPSERIRNLGHLAGPGAWRNAAPANPQCRRSSLVSRRPLTRLRERLYGNDLGFEHLGPERPPTGACRARPTGH